MTPCRGRPQETASLSTVQADADALAASVGATADLAERVSGKVRALDAEAARVAAAVERCDAVLERSAAVAGVAAGLEAGDFESAAACVATYLARDAEITARAVAAGGDPSGAGPAEGGDGDKDGGEQSSAQLATSRRTLESIVRQRFAAAAATGDGPAASRFAALFPPLGLAEEGLGLLVSYLCTTVGTRAKAEYESLSDAITRDERARGASTRGGVPPPEEADFGTALGALFRDIAAALEGHDAMLRGAFGGGVALARAVAALQAECDARGSVLLRRLAQHRRLDRLLADVRASRAVSGASSSFEARGGGRESGLDPRDVEPVCEELLAVCAAAEEYGAYMGARGREASALASSEGPGLPPALAAVASPAALRSGAFNARVQELVGAYVSLEEYYMAESVARASALDARPEGGLVTSLVDDAFYLLRKCAGRALATGSVQCGCAVLNHVANLLANELREGLTKRLRGAPAKLAALAPGAPGGRGGGAAGDGPGANAAADVAAALNNPEVAADYVLKLRKQLEAAAGECYPAAGDRERVRSCLADFGDTASAFRQLAASATEQLAAALTPRLRPALDGAAATGYEVSDGDYASGEAAAADGWVGRVASSAESLLSWLQPLLTPAGHDALAGAVIEACASRLEAVLLQKRFTQLGGLQLERDVRALTALLGGMTSRPVRDKMTRLAQMATALSLESARELLEYWGDNAGGMTWRLTAAEVKRVLGLRVDFRAESIAALRL